MNSPEIQFPKKEINHKERKTLLQLSFSRKSQTDMLSVISSLIPAEDTAHLIEI